MNTNQRVECDIVSAIQTRVATVTKSVISEVAHTSGRIVLGTVDPESGRRTRYVLKLEEVKDSPQLPDKTSEQSHEATAEPEKGCCGNPACKS